MSSNDPPARVHSGHGGETRDPVEPSSFLHRLLGNLPGMAYRCRNDEHWTMEFVSPGSEALTGVPPGELVGSEGRSFGSLIHDDDRARVWQDVQGGLQGSGRFDIAYRIVRPNGSVRQVWERGVGVPEGSGDDGGFAVIEGFITDITDRHELALELREAEARYAILADQSLAGVYVIEDGRFSHVNGRFAEIFGLSVYEVLALESVQELVHPDDRDQVATNIRLRLEGTVDRLEQVFRGLRAVDGQTIHVEAHGSVVRRDGGPAILGVLLDVSDRVRATERYHQTQKMEALGRLAGGIAHDFNNVLSVVRTLAELLQIELGDDASVAEDLEEMKRAAERGASLSRQLMTFSRPKPDRIEQLSLSDAVSSLMPMLERILGADVKLVIELAPDLPTVDVDPSHVEQVVMNLVINARDAMPDGGTLTVRSWSGMIAGPRGPRRPAVLLSVTDTGVGIPDAIRRRIFEPFFTTKGSQGTGLGLGNVWTIVNGYGGSVDVASTEGAGSTFTVCFPAATHRS